MCGIVACLETYTSFSIQRLLASLALLEYRGYDSAGLAAVFSDKHVLVHKVAGRIQHLKEKIDPPQKENEENGLSWSAICHTRWATHGEVTAANAHPHASDNNNTFLIVHNGVISNYVQLRNSLTSNGYQPKTSVDSELIALLCLQELHAWQREERKDRDAGIAQNFVSTEVPNEFDPSLRKENAWSLAQLVCKALQHVQGSFAVCIISALRPNELVCARRQQPLLFGQTETQFVAASDVAAFHAYGVERARVLPDNSILHLNYNRKNNNRKTSNEVIEHHFFDLSTFQEQMICNESLFVNVPSLSTNQSSDLTTTFMRKEIDEQPFVVDQSARSIYLQLLTLPDLTYKIRNARRLFFIACGTSHHATLCAKMFFETAAATVLCERASEFLDRNASINDRDCCIFVSQSGETADTLDAFRYCKQCNAFCIALVNTAQSTLDREAHVSLQLNCGVEVGVASSKAYTCQIAALALLGSANNEDSLLSAISSTCRVIEQCLRNTERKVRELAAWLHDKPGLLLVGRGAQGVATCMEGALKIKELCYVFADPLSAGELKHGSLALVSSTMPIIVLATQQGEQSLEAKLHNGLQQIMARGGRPILITHSSAENDLLTFIIDVPRSPDARLQCLVDIIPLQLLACFWATLKGYDVDKPRNLAKSVTVQ